MRRPVTALAAVALTAGLVGAPATAAWAVVGVAEPHTYSGGTTPPGDVESNTPATPGTPNARTVTTPTTPAATLPFTGGELVLLVTAGAAALGAGGALVVASRRRSPLAS